MDLQIACAVEPFTLTDRNLGPLKGLCRGYQGHRDNWDCVGFLVHVPQNWVLVNLERVIAVHAWNKHMVVGYLVPLQLFEAPAPPSTP